MKTFFPLLMLLLGVFPEQASAHDYFVTADVDRQIDGIDDTLYVEPGDTIEVAVWFTSEYTGPVIAANPVLCHSDPGIVLAGYVDSIGPPWSIEPPVPLSDSCHVFQAVDFTFASPVACPFLHGVARYSVSPGFVGGFVLANGSYSGVFDTSFDDSFVFSLAGVVLLPATKTATQSSSWSGIKTLFR